jgi:hypothetical protein
MRQKHRLRRHGIGPSKEKLAKCRNESFIAAWEIHSGVGDPEPGARRVRARSRMGERIGGRDASRNDVFRLGKIFGQGPDVL